MLGLVALNVLSTCIWFGLWPIAIVWHAAADGWRRTALPLLLYMACLHAIFGVASAFAIKQQAQVFVDVGIQVMYEVGTDGNLQLRAEKALDIIPKVIPQLPWTFAAYALALLGTLGIVIAWGRRCRT